MSSRVYAYVVAAWVLAAVVAVVSTLGRTGLEPGEERALPELPPRERPAASFETEDTLPSALAGVRVEPVEDGWMGPGERPFFVAVRSSEEADPRFRQIGRRTYYLALRLEPPEAEPVRCASCHQGRSIVGERAETGGEAVHQNIEAVHPEQTGAQCLGCHAAEDVSLLRLQRGGTTPAGHAYRLCAQCHYPQVESWAKGAHGKRLVGWRGRRVVMGCADCHDPHRPATELRPPLVDVRIPGALMVEEHEAEEGRGEDDSPASESRSHGGAP